LAAVLAVTGAFAVAAEATLVLVAADAAEALRIAGEAGASAGPVVPRVDVDLLTTMMSLFAFEDGQR